MAGAERPGRVRSIHAAFASSGRTQGQQVRVCLPDSHWHDGAARFRKRSRRGRQMRRSGSVHTRAGMRRGHARDGAAHLLAQHGALLRGELPSRGLLHGGGRAVLRFDAVPQITALNARRAIARWLRPASAGWPDKGQQEK